MGTDVSDVGHPHPVRLGHIEPLLHTIGRRHRGLAITPSMPPAIAGLGMQSFIAHQAVDTMLAAALAQITQVVGNLAITIDAATFQPGLLDQPQQPLILPLPRRDWRCAPGIVAAGMHFHHPAHASHRMLAFMAPDECVPYRDPLAKYAAVSSTGRCNTFGKFRAWRHKSKDFSWPCIEL